MTASPTHKNRYLCFPKIDRTYGRTCAAANLLSTSYPQSSPHKEPGRLTSRPCRPGILTRIGARATIVVWIRSHVTQGKRSHSRALLPCSGVRETQGIRESARRQGRTEHPDSQKISLGLNQPISLQEPAHGSLRRIRLGSCFAGEARKAALAAERPTARMAQFERSAL